MTPGERIARPFGGYSLNLAGVQRLAADIDRALAAQRQADIRALQRRQRREGAGLVRSWIGSAIEVLRARADKGKARR